MDEYYSIGKAAKMLHVHRSTIYRWINDGKIKRMHIKSFPNGVTAVNARAFIKPVKRKVYTRKVEIID